MKKIKKKDLKNIYYKIRNKLWLLTTTLMLMPTKIFAADGSISTAEVTQATENIKNAVIKLAMPIGGILVFVSIVIIAIKMIVNSNNANKRSESVGSLAWVCAGTMLLGLSLIVSGIILSVATNGSGALITGGSSNA